MALAALRAGKDVLVEKPMALRVEDCNDMTEAAIEADAVLAVAENLPFRPAILKAKRLLPRIGQPRLLVATALHAPSNQTAIGILFDYAVHYVRAVRCLCGEPLTVYALGGAEEHALLLFEGEGWEASLSLSWKASAGRCPGIRHHRRPGLAQNLAGESSGGSLPDSARPAHARRLAHSALVAHANGWSRRSYSARDSACQRLTL